MARNMERKPHSALVLVGHGSTENPDSSDPTHRHVAELRRRGCFAEVVPAFWKEEPSLREVLRMVDAEEVYVVPNFISEGYFTSEVIPRELGLDGRTTKVGGKTVHYCDPVGIHPSMTNLLLARAAEIAPGLAPAECSLLVVGHGTSLNARSRQAIEEQVRAIREHGPGYAEVLDTYMEEQPLVAEWDRHTRAPNVIVVPFFISDGLHSYQDIPVLLGIEEEPGPAASRREIFRHNPHELRGRRLFYASAIGTEPHLADVVLDQVEEFDRKFKQDAFGLPVLRPALLDTLRRWIAAGGRRIGQVAVRPDSGGRPDFRLCHVADLPLVEAGPGHGLEEFEGPEAARDLAAVDAAGDFRPLPSAPDLRRGWVVNVSGWEDLRRTLDLFYPAALGLWHHHASGDLASVSLRAKLARQTGMYRAAGRISDLDAQDLLARTCDPTHGCLKRILWTLDEGRPVTGLPAEKFLDRGARPAPNELPILCAEACNLVVAAAREKVKAG